jgi:hypothetical protein
MINIATVQSRAFKILINGISKIIDKGKLIFTEEHIKILETNKDNDILIHIKLYSENFEEYFVKEKKEINIDFKILQKITKTIKNNETIGITYNEGDTFWTLKLSDSEKGINNSYKINLIQYEKNEINIPPTKFNSEVSLSTTSFKELLNQSKFISSDKINVSFDGVSLIFNFENKNIEKEVLIQENKDNMYIGLNSDSELIEGDFDYKNILKCCEFTNLCNMLNIYFKKDFPIVFLYNIANLGVIKLLFTPLI